MKRCLLILALLVSACVATAQVEQETLAQVRAFQYAEAITPSDGANLPHVTKAIYVGTATAGQTIKVDLQQSGTITLNNVVQGTFLGIAAKKVYATGTTATNLISFF
jgi:hypothetical protein